MSEEVNILNHIKLISIKDKPPIQEFIPYYEVMEALGHRDRPPWINDIVIEMAILMLQCDMTVLYDNTLYLESHINEAIKDEISIMRDPVKISSVWKSIKANPLHFLSETTKEFEVGDSGNRGYGSLTNYFHEGVVNTRLMGPLSGVPKGPFRYTVFEATALACIVIRAFNCSTASIFRSTSEVFEAMLSISSTGNVFYAATQVKMGVSIEDIVGKLSTIENFPSMATDFMIWFAGGIDGVTCRRMGRVFGRKVGDMGKVLDIKYEDIQCELNSYIDILISKDKISKIAMCVIHTMADGERTRIKKFIRDSIII